MVTDLFHVDTSAVWHPSLIGLTQDRVERFVEDVARISKRNRVRHDALHAFDRVIRECCLIQVQRCMNRHCGYQI